MGILYNSNFVFVKEVKRNSGGWPVGSQTQGAQFKCRVKSRQFVAKGQMWGGWWLWSIKASDPVKIAG